MKVAHSILIDYILEDRVAMKKKKED